MDQGRTRKRGRNKNFCILADKHLSVKNLPIKHINGFMRKTSDYAQNENRIPTSVLCTVVGSRENFSSLQN